MTGKKITDRLKDPSQESVEITTGIPIDGSVDPTGEHPRRNNWYGSSISQAARGVKINSLALGGSIYGVNFDVPLNQASMFPFNQANETPSGHSFELDDTPGAERVLIKHHTGAGVELKPDGSVVVVAKSHRIEVVGADHNVVVQGQGNITYDGDLNMIVNGNYNLTVNGTYNVDVGANHNHSVHGTQITEVGDVHQTIVRGNKDTKVYGDTLDLNIGERKIVSKKDIRMITGRDHIVNSARNVRATAEDTFVAASGKQLTLTSEKANITGRYGKIGGEHWHHVGSLFTGPGESDAQGDQGTKTVFHGNLIGRALESWTSKYSLFARESHSAHISNFSAVAKVADKATSASRALYATTALLAESLGPVIPKPVSDSTEFYPDWAAGYTYEGSSGGVAGASKPDYKFKWGWNVKEFTAYEQQTKFLADGAPDTLQGIDGPLPVSPYYTTNEDWFEVWNKTSPFAVRKVYVDFDGSLEEKISKIDGYTYYFRWSPSTAEVRSKLRTMDGAEDDSTSPEKQTDGEKCISTLLDENRISPDYKNGAPSGDYEAKRKGKQSPYDGPRFGHTLLGNPVERASKTVKPKNKDATRRTILADPVYNPDKYDKPITSSTKLSKSSTIAKFLGAPGSRSSLEYIPLLEDRQNLARQWYLHAWLMEGIASSEEFKDYRLQVTEGYYHPAKGIRQEADANTEYWREPFKKEDGGNCQKSITSGSEFINELKHNGRAVIYTLYNSRGRIDYGKTFELALYIRDTFFYDQLSLDYDMTRPDFVMTQQLIIVMPEIKKDFRASFEMKVCTYFNRQMFDGGDLVEITD